MSYDSGHEPDTVRTRTIAGLGLGLLGLIVLSMLLSGLALQWLFPSSSLTGADQMWQLQNRIPGVQPNQAYDRKRILAEEQAFLKQYAWQDAEHTIARIPIERSIELQSSRERRNQQENTENGAPTLGPPLEDSQ